MMKKGGGCCEDSGSIPASDLLSVSATSGEDDGFMLMSILAEAEVGQTFSPGSDPVMSLKIGDIILEEYSYKKM